MKYVNEFRTHRMQSVIKLWQNSFQFANKLRMNLKKTAFNQMKYLLN